MPKPVFKATLRRGQSMIRILTEKANNAPDEIIRFVESLDSFEEYINEEGNFVSDAFLDYLRPLVGEMPVYGRLSNKRVSL